MVVSRCCCRSREQKGDPRAARSRPQATLSAYLIDAEFTEALVGVGVDAMLLKRRDLVGLAAPREHGAKEVGEHPFTISAFTEFLDSRCSNPRIQEKNNYLRTLASVMRQCRGSAAKHAVMLSLASASAMCSGAFVVPGMPVADRLRPPALALMRRPGCVSPGARPVRPLPRVPRPGGRRRGAAPCHLVPESGKRDEGTQVEDGEGKESMWEGLVATWKEVNEPIFEEDMCYAALAVKYRLEIIESTKECMVSPEQEVREWAIAERQQALLELLPNIGERDPGLIYGYWMVRWSRIWKSQRLRSSLPAVANLFNAAFIAIFLRLSLPRLLAMESMGDLAEFSKELGLPGREDLLGYLAYADGYDFGTKFAAFTVIFAFEKVLMLGEFIPFGVVLPTISPALFGSVAAGTLVTATSSTMASSVNFWLGRTFLAERVKNFSLPGQAPIGESSWFQALYRRFDSDNFPTNSESSLIDRVPEGFKAMLLLRLAPLLPIPVDGHWYVAGTTPVRYWEFFAAHFIGTLKVALLDAFLGSLLLQAVTDTQALEESTKTVVILETVSLILVSVVVTNIATNVFTQLLAEEGVSMDNMMGLDDSTSQARVTAADAIWLAADERELEAAEREQRGDLAGAARSELDIGLAKEQSQQLVKLRSQAKLGEDESVKGGLVARIARGSLADVMSVFRASVSPRAVSAPSHTCVFISASPHPLPHTQS